MLNLNIETGLQEYKINGAASVLFNPTDPNFIERIFDAFNSMDEMHEEYRKQIGQETDGVKLFKIARTMDAKMRELIDETLGGEVCGAAFGNISMYATADGLPIWANLMLAIVDEMDDAFAREKKASNPRIQKYTEKFKKKAG